MVRAILAGTKTQTRRVVKGAPEDWSPVQPQVYAPTIVDRHGDEQPGPDAFGAGDAQGDHWIRCPYGQPGEQLWVRETFAHMYRGNARPEMRRSDDVVYAADGFTPDEYAYGTWKPSIHMPRWASRITLEVTDVKVERLQDISEADAAAEGCGFLLPKYEHWDGDADLYRKLYRVLWRRINGPGSWDANPWVWCVSFKRLEAL